MPLLRKLIILLTACITATLFYWHLFSVSPKTAITNPVAMGSVSERPIRLAILLNDTPQPGTLARVGDYSAVFSQLLAAATAPEPLESQLTITSHDVVNDLNSYPDLNDVDALLLTGSKHNAFENDPWILKGVQTREVLIALSDRAADKGVHESALHYVEDQRNRERDEG